MSTTLLRLTAADRRWLDDLTALLLDAVADGASVGFLASTTADEARAYWTGVFDELDRSLVLWLVAVDGVAVGTVQLSPCGRPNGRHRAEVQKLLVRRDCRGRGMARQLLDAVDAHAVADDRTLLVLDTQAGSSAEAMYRHLGWQHAGGIPDYATAPDGALCGTVFFYKRLAPRA